MKFLHFEEMMILSKTEKKARKIPLKMGKNIVLGENHVGKSTFVKSLYNALGADTPQLTNTRWKKSNPIYCLRFSLKGKTYYIVRDESYFGLFDESKNLVGRYRGISREGGIASPICDMLGFNVELENKDERMVRLTQSHYFLPFYIDQDEGWSNSWASFKALTAIKRYRANMIEYHLGIRPQEFYDAKRKIHNLQAIVRQLSDEKSTLVSVRDSYQSRKQTMVIDIDPESFREEIDELVAAYNQSYEQQQSILNKVKEARNKKLGIESEIQLLNHAIHELDKDYQFIENPETPDVIGCPTCGTEFHNSISERFGILDDINYCHSLLDQRRKDLVEATDQLKALNSEYRISTREVENLDAILKRKRKDISFRDIVRSEGYKEIIQSISADVTELDRRQTDAEKEVEALKPATTVDREHKKTITAFYQSKMKESLNKLNVSVLGEDAYKTVEKVISDIIGSALPRALLAQHMSFLHTMQKFNSFTVCPLVIDSPFQQEQDFDNSDAIFDFIFSGHLEGQQMILATISTPESERRAEATEDVNVVRLGEKYGLLQAEAFEEVSNEIIPMHNLTLSTDTSNA